MTSRSNCKATFSWILSPRRSVPWKRLRDQRKASEESVTVPSRTARSVCANAGHAKKLRERSSFSELQFRKVIETADYDRRGRRENGAPCRLQLPVVDPEEVVRNPRFRARTIPLLAVGHC